MLPLSPRNWHATLPGSISSPTKILAWEFINTCSLSDAGTCLTLKGDIYIHTGYLLLLEVFYSLIHVSVPKYFANSQGPNKSWDHCSPQKWAM